VSEVLRFEFATTPLVVFGEGAVGRLGEFAARLGRRAWLVTGGGSLERAGVVERAVAILAAAGVAVARQSVRAEPDTGVVDDGARAAARRTATSWSARRRQRARHGQGHRACWATGRIARLPEVVGRGRPIGRPSLPVIAVPTTAGTGSEATLNTVIADPASGTKASIRHGTLLPRVALLDPALTRSLPPDVTARTGLDAIIQLIEPYVSRRAHPMIDALALEGLRRAAPALPRAYADGEDAGAREDLMLAALWSGMALAHCGLGAAHALAGPLGGAFPVPHGLACAATMPFAMAANLRAADGSPDGAVTIRRYADVARAMGAADGEDDRVAAAAGAEHLRELCELLNAEALRVRITREAILGLLPRARSGPPA
jgi:alcohol dehydrogenase class IV